MEIDNILTLMFFTIIPIFIFTFFYLYSNYLIKRRDYLKRQNDYQNMLLENNKCALDCFEKLPVLLKKAVEYLDIANNDFKDRAFAPFWDSVEQATVALGQYAEQVNNISACASNHVRLTSFFNGVLIDFLVEEKASNSVKEIEFVNKKLEVIVRNAQRDFQFAMIYEQRKTNKLLQIGFATLAEALNKLSSRMENSINMLVFETRNVTKSINQFNSSVAVHLSSINKGVYKTNGLIKQMRERHDKALELLNNIQLRKKPYDENFKGDY